MLCVSGRLVLFALCGAALAQETATPQMTARELFYNAQTASTPQAAPTTAGSKSATPKTKPQAAKAARPVSTLAPAPEPAPAPVAVAERLQSAPPEAARIVPAAASLSQPLGLKYSILKSSGDENQMAEVAPATVFHSGDHIRFNVETNSSGFLYIFTRGSSGTWQVLFPSPSVESGSNRVEGFHSYTMPPGHRFTFDEQPGTEKLFLVLSRTPVPDLENLMYSLQKGQMEPAADPARPKPESEGKTLVAGLSIDDSTVGRLRDAYSRDLIIEKVDEATPGDRKEKAVYVVNPHGSADSRVVADLQLVHQ